MKKLQEKKYSMYKAVEGIFDATLAQIIALMPQMPDAIALLKSLIAQIGEQAAIQIENRKGIRFGKVVTRDELINFFYIMAGQVKSYAVNDKLYALRDEVSYTMSKFNAMADAKLIVTAKLITDKAVENLAALGAYGVDNDSIAKAAELVESYALQLAKPRIGITNKKTATAALKVLFRKADELLDEKMDTLVIIVKELYPQFYNDYTTARILVNPPTSHLAVRCLVTDEDNKPIANVVATIHGQTKKYRTTAKGQFYVRSLPDGVHVFTFTKAGYETQVINVATNKRERTDLHVILTRLP